MNAQDKKPADLRPIVQVRPLFLNRADTAAFLAISESQLVKLVAIGSVPKPRQISEGRVAWRIDELEQWGKERPESESLPPRNTGARKKAA